MKKSVSIFIILFTLAILSFIYDAANQSAKSPTNSIGKTEATDYTNTLNTYTQEVVTETPGDPTPTMEPTRTLEPTIKPTPTKEPTKSPDKTPARTPVLEAEGFINIQALDNTILVDLKYATTDNCVKKKIYDYNICIFRKSTALKLAKVSAAVAKDGYRLKIWDGYRVFSASWELWNAYKDPKYVSSPDLKDKHCKGTAVDLTLVDANGNELEMPTGFDDFSPKASGQDATGKAYENWQYLRKVMTDNGFRAISSEWWHYNDTDTSKYDIVDLDVNALFGGQ